MTTVLPAQRTAPDLLHTPVMTAPVPHIVDGAWRIDQNHIGFGLAWMLTHLPTGWTEKFGTRYELQVWLDRPEHERRKSIRAMANSRIKLYTSRLADESVPEAVRDNFKRHMVKHRQRLAVLDGAPIPVISSAAIVVDDTVDVEHRCGCGGYLITVDGKPQHVDACEYCYDGSECEQRDRHVMCLRPEAAQCDHHTCTVANDAWVKCSHGHRDSCGNHEGC